MYVIAGATGHTGSVVASTLLAQGHKVRVIVRDEKKGAAWKDKGAEVALARLENAAELTAALRGADGVYALVPPDFAADDPLAAQTGVAEAWGKAVAAAKPRHVVYLSSIGAELDGGNGPILVAHRAEERLRATGVKVTALRAAYFMENWGGVVHPVRSDGVLPSMITPGRAVPMVATADIGRTAAGALVEGGRGRRIIELAGPRDYAPADVAAAIGKPVQEVPLDAVVPTYTGFGVSVASAELFREMYGAIASGHVAFERAPTRGTVEIDTTLRHLLAK